MRILVSGAGPTLVAAVVSSPILSVNNTYGPLWRTPTQILAGRLLKFGAQVTLKDLTRASRAAGRSETASAAATLAPLGSWGYLA